MFTKSFLALGALYALTISEKAFGRPLAARYVIPDITPRDDTSTCAIVTVTIDDATSTAVETATSATSVLSAVTTSVDEASCAVPTATVTITVDAAATTDAATSAATASISISSSATAAASAATGTSTLSASQIGDFGSCTVPQIEFGTGFDGRKETAFQPVDKVSYNHGSADNIDIITQFMCDQLVNSCGANALAQTTCANAKAAADTVTAKTGGQADAFNAVFGIKTDFAAVSVVSDQGVTQSIVATTAASTTSATVSQVASSSLVSVSAATQVAVATSVASATTAASAAASSSTLSASQIGNFGSCSVPQIEFGTGFDGRKETAFQPVDQVSYNHGSADNIAVITSFICNALTNTCGADALAKSTCATASTAASSATALTGAQADAFNAVFGIKTDFAAVPEVSNTGVTIVASGDAAASTSAVASTAAATSAATSATVSSAAATSAAASSAALTSATAASATASAATSTASSSSIGNFGSCSVPQIEFGTGFDGRKETAFQPVDEVSYNHGSADNIDIITQFMCDQLVNSCGADATAQATCASAKAAADTVTAKTGGQADAFNAVFGIKTDFAAISPVSDQGVTQSVVASTAAVTASA